MAGITRGCNFSHVAIYLPVIPQLLSNTNKVSPLFQESIIALTNLVLLYYFQNLNKFLLEKINVETSLLPPPIIYAILSREHQSFLFISSAMNTVKPILQASHGSPQTSRAEVGDRDGENYPRGYTRMYCFSPTQGQEEKTSRKLSCSKQLRKKKFLVSPLIKNRSMTA